MAVLFTDSPLPEDQGSGPVTFDDSHTIEDIVRYAVKCSGGSTVETRCICDWIDEEKS